MSTELSNFDPAYMMQEYTMLKAELDRYEELYTAITAEIDEAKRKTRIPYVYMSSQYSTLTSIMSARQSVISKLFDMKKVVEDFKLRYLKLAADDEENGPDNQVIIRDLIKALSDKTIPYEDLAAVAPVDDVTAADYGSMANIADQLDAQFYTDPEGVLRSTAEDPASTSLPDLDITTEEDDELAYEQLVHDMDKIMQTYQLKVTNHPDGDLAIVQEIPYNNSMIYVEYDTDKLEEDEPDLFAFIDDEQNFDIDEAGEMLIPAGFTSYVLNVLTKD